MPPKDNIAFESQQYAAQFMPMVQRAQEGTTQAISGAVDRLGQGLELGLRRQALQQQALQAAQEDERRNRLTASELATDQIRRQQAMEELQWAREVHTTGMLKYQRTAAKAQAELLVAQAEKAKQELGTPPISRISTQHLDYMLAMGGEKYEKGKWVPATEEERADARSRMNYRPENLERLRDADAMRGAQREREVDVKERRQGMLEQESATKSSQAAERIAIQERNAAARERAGDLTAINAERDGLQTLLEMTRSRPAPTDEEKKAKQQDIQTLEGRLRENIERAKAAGMPVTEPGQQGQNGAAPTAGEDFYERMLKALVK